MGNGIDGNRLNISTIIRNPDPYVDALLTKNQWALDASRTITFSFTKAWTSFFQLDTGPIELNSNAATAELWVGSAVRQIFASYANVANINFAQVPDNADGAGDIRITASFNSFGNIAGFTVLPVPSNDFYGWGGDIFLSNSVLRDNKAGSYGYFTMLHEIGHALGLKHPGNYNGDGFGTPPFFPNPAQDTTAFSVMSYNNDKRIDGSPWKPAIADIAALQYLYGANMRAAPGDNVYTLGTFAPETIWDPNGVNTLTGRGLAGDQIISLKEFSYSYVGAKITGALAAGTKITNGDGGIGKDQLIGNDLDNRLRGDAGDDVIQGGGGIDTALYASARANYTIQTSADRKSVTVTSASPLAPDGVDQLSGVEYLQFTDRTVVIDRSLLTSSGLSIADQLSVVYLGRGVGVEYRDGVAAQAANGPSVELQKSLFAAGIADRAFSTLDNAQSVTNKTFLNIFGVQASAFEQFAWANAVAIGATTLEQLPWAIFTSYLGATNVPPSYQIPAQSRIIAASAFTDQAPITADAKLGAPGGTGAEAARSWLLSIRSQPDAARKVASVGPDLSTILTTNKFTERGSLEFGESYAASYGMADPLPLIGIS